MHTRLVLLVTVALLTLCAAGCKSVKGDVGVLCRIAGEVEADTTVAPEHRARQVSERFLATSPSGDMRRAMQGAAAAAEGDRYRLMRRVAQEGGAPEWTCPALERVWAP